MSDLRADYRGAHDGSLRVACLHRCNKCLSTRRYRERRTDSRRRRRYFLWFFRQSPACRHYCPCMPDNMLRHHVERSDVLQQAAEGAHLIRTPSASLHPVQLRCIEHRADSDHRPGCSVPRHDLPSRHRLCHSLTLRSFHWLAKEHLSGSDLSHTHILADRQSSCSRVVSRRSA